MLDENDTAKATTTTPSTDPTPGSSSEAQPGAPAPDAGGSEVDGTAPLRKAAKKTAKKAAKKTTKKAAAAPDSAGDGPAESAPDGASDGASDGAGDAGDTPVKKTAAKKTAAKKSAANKTAAKKTPAKKAAAKKSTAKKTAGATTAGSDSSSASEAGESQESGSPAAPLFKAPEPTAAPARKKAEPQRADAGDNTPADDQADQPGSQSGDSGDSGDSDGGSDEQGNRRRRRRGGRRRRRGGGGEGDGSGSGSADDADDGSGSDDEDEESSSQSGKSGNRSGGKSGNQSGNQSGKSGNQSGGKSGNKSGSGSGNKSGDKSGNKSGGGDGSADADDSGNDGDAGSRRRRRRRRAGEEGEGGPDDPEKTVTRVRKPRSAEDEITSVQGSTRLEAKKQRRREGREAGRRRAPIVSEAEFLARREAVDRVMVIRQRRDLTQIAVLEDKVLVEHYVARESQSSLIGNVYLGRVQNVLPSMEAAFIDIGKGRNAVLYAGEVNWDALGAGNGPRKIEQVLKSGQPILVQVTKDPIGHKGARLTSQVSLPGRFLVYVPDGNTSGISRKLPDTERTRLKTVLKEIVPDTAGVIVRTAAEGASEDELTHDVERLTARWSEIESKVEQDRDKGGPQLLYAEPDLTLKVVRDLFTEDFAKLVVSGDDAWEMVDGYVKNVAPDLEGRLERYDDSDAGKDVFAAYRIDEQIAKGLDRKVWLPSGGSLIIERTEAMTVVDVNTGKFTGSGGNLEETVTKNNLEAAEEIVRQLRLRDIGGIIVVDFIDMVLESNRDLVLRRLVECLGRDRTRHQVAEVTSLGLVQMTRKRIGTGLLEAFSETCEHCLGRGVVVHHEPVESKKQQDDEPRRGRRGRRGGSGSGGNGSSGDGGSPKATPTPKDIAAMARHEPKPTTESSDATDDEQPSEGDTAKSGSADKPDSSPSPEPSEPAAEEKPVDGASEQTSGADEPAEPSPGTSATAADTEPETETAPEPGPESPEPTDGSSTPDAGSTPSPDPTTAPEPVREAAPPAGPRLVTTSRRVARRPAGPPTGGATAVAERSTGDSTDDSTDEPGDRPADDPTDGTISDGAISDVTTSPDGAGAVTEPADDGADGAVGESSGDGVGGHFHVPIKKKGSRKR